jgi:transcriptional regulator with XRE-family HTH domain
MPRTELGKELRSIREDVGENLKQMAEKLDVTSSFLSSVELGKSRCSPKLVKNIYTAYGYESFERIFKLYTKGLNFLALSNLDVEFFTILDEIRAIKMKEFIATDHRMKEL